MKEFETELEVLDAFDGSGITQSFGARSGFNNQTFDGDLPFHGATIQGSDRSSDGTRELASGRRGVDIVRDAIAVVDGALSETAGVVVIIRGVQVLFFKFVDVGKMALMGGNWGRHHVDNLVRTSRWRHKFFAGAVTTACNANRGEGSNVVHSADGRVVVNVGERVQSSAMTAHSDHLRAMAILRAPRNAPKKFPVKCSEAEIDLCKTFDHPGDAWREGRLNASIGKVLINVITNKHFSGLGCGFKFLLKARVVVASSSFRTGNAVVTDDVWGS